MRAFASATAELFASWLKDSKPYFDEALKGDATHLRAAPCGGVGRREVTVPTRKQDEEMIAAMARYCPSAASMTFGLFYPVGERSNCVPEPDESGIASALVHVGSA